jgi:hypothetical protein
MKRNSVPVLGIRVKINERRGVIGTPDRLPRFKTLYLHLLFCRVVISLAPFLLEWPTVI